MDPILWLAEHEGAKVIEIDVDKSGMVDLDRLKQVVIDNKGKIAFISIMHSNNEVGTLQDIAQIV
jgi:cysteine desulfurase